MSVVKDGAVATMIGDVVGSRRAERRVALHRSLSTALQQANDGSNPVDPLRVTVGDEFQGAFLRLEEAVRAGLRIRLALLPEHDVRFGIGWGEVFWVDESTGVQDGPGWWSARKAIEQAKEQAHGGLAGVRTVFEAAPSAGDPAATRRWNALLLCRDALVSGLDGRSVTVLSGLLEGRSQQDIASDLGITASAVSQRVRRDGLAMLAAADGLLEVP